jgi:hypothetical protein
MVDDGTKERMMSRFEREGGVLVDVDERTHTIILDRECGGWWDVDHPAGSSAGRRRTPRNGGVCR